MVGWAQPSYLPIRPSNQGFFAWDVSSFSIIITEGTLMKEYNSDTTLKRSLTLKHVPDILIYTERSGFFHYLSYKSKILYKTNTKDSEYSLPLPNGISGPTSLCIGEFYWYLKYNDKKYLEIEKESSWQISEVRPEKSLPNQSSEWYLENGFLYSFSWNSNEMYLTKTDYLGTSISWNTSIPMCGKSPIVKSDESFVFVACVGTNIVQKLSVNSGKLLDKIYIEGPIRTFEASFSSLIFLLEDSHVVHYSVNFQYVGSYFVQGKKLPKLSSLKVSSNFITTVLCDITDTNSCLNPKLALWDLLWEDDRTTVTYVDFEEVVGSDSNLEIPPSNGINTIQYNSITLNEAQIMSQISSQPPVSFIENNLLHINYYSGSGSLQNGTCGDPYLHELIIDISSQRLLEHKIFELEYSEIGGLRSYASILISIKNTQYYLIHGGLSCDLQTVFSKIFLIDLSTKTYILPNQSRNMSW